jgi:hypothetical protein
VPKDERGKRFASYLDVSFSFETSQKLAFTGNQIEWEPPCSPHCGTIGKGCADIVGEIVLRDHEWRQPGDLGGCREDRE